MIRRVMLIVAHAYTGVMKVTMLVFLRDFVVL